MIGCLDIAEKVLRLALMRCIALQWSFSGLLFCSYQVARRFTEKHMLVVRGQFFQKDNVCSKFIGQHCLRMSISCSIRRGFSYDNDGSPVLNRTCVISTVPFATLS